MKPVVIVAGVGPGIGTSIARAFGAERFRLDDDVGAPLRLLQNWDGTSTL